jgi:hypothetical protein
MGGISAGDPHRHVLELVCRLLFNRAAGLARLADVSCASERKAMDESMRAVGAGFPVSCKSKTPLEDKGRGAGAALGHV